MRPTISLPTILLLAAALIGALSQPGCEGPANAALDRPVDDLERVEFEPVSTADLVEQRTYFGGLVASSQVALYPLLSEQITSFPVEEGSRVEKGQTVAVIRSAGIRQTKAQTKAQIEAMDVSLANLSRDLERARQLHRESIVTRQALEQIESSYLSNQAQRKALEAGLRQVSITARNAVIKAPFDGVVTGKRLEAGDIASPQAPLCSIARTDPIRMDLGVIERDLALVRTGMRVEVTVDAHPGRVFVGSIAKILPTLEAGTRTNEVRVEIPNPFEESAEGPPLKPGMFGRARIIIEDRPGSVVTPARSLMVDPEGRSGFRRALVVDDGGIARGRTVEIGIRNGDMVEVKAGLRPGDRVVVHGQYGTEEGARVEAVEARREAGEGEASS